MASAASVVERIKRDLRIPAHASVRLRELELFEQAMGSEALERQIELGQRMHRCCWEPRDGDHHPACPAGGRFPA